MFDDDKIYEAFVKGLSEDILSFNEFKSIPMPKVVLQKDIVELIKRQFSFKDLLNLNKKTSTFYLEDAEHNSYVRYDFERYVSSTYTATNQLIITKTDNINHGTTYVYSSYGRDGDIFTYGFVKHNCQGILVQYVTLTGKTGAAKIELRVFDKDTSRFIGDGALYAKHLISSEKYGVMPDISESYDFKNYDLEKAYELFKSKSEEFLSDSQNLKIQ